MALLSFPCPSNPTNHFLNPTSTRFPQNRLRQPPLFFPHRNLRFSLTVTATTARRNPKRTMQLVLPRDLLRQLSTSVIIILGVSIRVCSASASTQIPLLTAAADCHTLIQQHTIQDTEPVEIPENVEEIEDQKLKAAFDSWKSKTYALTVPLRVVALRSSIPPSWVKDFLQSQGRRVRLRPQFPGNLGDIFSDLSISSTKRKINPKSVAAADIVTVGDSWLNFAIKKDLIEPIQGVEDQDWFRDLSDKWKKNIRSIDDSFMDGEIVTQLQNCGEVCVFFITRWSSLYFDLTSGEVYLRRNSEGKLDSGGSVWAAPYRWGTMVIAYKKSKFQKHNLAPIEDWADLWRPELAGKISMVDSPREVVGAVLKYMGASYNTSDIDGEVAGGREAVQQKLELLGKQVRLFDNMHYLKAFGVGDVWVAVGWSSDVIPAAKRMSNVAVIVPKSGASLWADLWAIPAASKYATNKIGGRVRGPSPLIHQWIEFCLQPARALPFKQEVVPGALPSDLESAQVEVLKKVKPKLDTNLIAGVPPAEVLARCEFLEPLSDAALSDYQWLIASLQKPSNGLFLRAQNYVSSVVQTFWPKLNLKVT